MTPDTAALRARPPMARTESVALTIAERDALCDAADEVERLREEVRRMARDLAETAMHDAADEVERLMGALARTETDVAVHLLSVREAHQLREAVTRLNAERDAARATHAALVADLRALCDQHIGAPCDCNAIAHSVRALLDRHAPEEGS